MDLCSGKPSHERVEADRVATHGTTALAFLCGLRSVHFRWYASSQSRRFAFLPALRGADRIGLASEATLHGGVIR